MAEDLQVNMMTVSKAYGRLESESVLERVRGRGMRVCASVAEGSVRERKSQLKPLADPVITRGQQLGLTDEQIIDVIRTVLRERKK
jgi:GntR family transcriptional regulator